MSKASSGACLGHHLRMSGAVQDIRDATCISDAFCIINMIIIILGPGTGDRCISWTSVAGRRPTSQIASQSCQRCQCAGDQNYHHDELISIVLVIIITTTMTIIMITVVRTEKGAVLYMWSLRDCKKPPRKKHRTW